MTVSTQRWKIIVQFHQNQIMHRRLYAYMVSDHYMGQEAIIPMLHNQALQALHITTKNPKNPKTLLLEKPLG